MAANPSPKLLLVPTLPKPDPDMQEKLQQRGEAISLAKNRGECRYAYATPCHGAYHNFCCIFAARKSCDARALLDFFSLLPLTCLGWRNHHIEYRSPFSCQFFSSVIPPRAIVRPRAEGVIKVGEIEKLINNTFVNKKQVPCSNIRTVLEH